MRFIWPMVLIVVTAGSACKSPGALSDASPSIVTAPASSVVPSANAARATGAADSAAEVLQTAAGALELHPVHHGTVWFRVGATVVWVDPWSEAKLEDPKADLVLITDIHPDHYDPPGLDKVRKVGTRIIAPPAVAEKISGALVMKNGDRREVGALTLEAIPMYNMKRGPSPGKFFHEKGRGNGYIVTFGNKRVYFSGDTECTEEMRALRNIDIAFVCMNLPYTMSPSEAAECVKAFKPKILVPYHYRGQNLGDLDAPLAGSGVEIHKHTLY